MNNLFLAIDVGTTSIKFRITDMDFKTIYSNSVKYDFINLNGDWTEIDPEVWFNIILNEFSIIFEHTWSKKIVGIGVTGQMHTISFIDNNGDPMRNSILWNDRRTKGLISTVKKQIKSLNDDIVNSDVLSTGSPLLNLLWLKENEPENFKNINKFLITKDYINFRLTGAIGTDYCDSSTSCMTNKDTNNWSDDIIEFFNFSEKIFPQIFSSTHVIGYLTDEISVKYNIEQNIAVIVGTGDNVATYISTGSHLTNIPVISLGTSAVLLSPKSSSDEKDRLKTITFKINNSNEAQSIIQGSLSSGGKSLDWWIEEILKTSDYVREQKDIDNNIILQNKCIYIPYLNGEKYIFENPNMFGAFIGLTPDTTRHELTLSVMEGVAFGLKYLYKKMNTHLNSTSNILLIGGGAKNKLWTKVIANILEANVFQPVDNGDPTNGMIQLLVMTLTNKTIKNDSNIELLHATCDKLVSYYNLKFESFTSWSKAIDNKSK